MLPSIATGPLGNEILATIEPGTRVCFERPEAAAQFHALFINETAPPEQTAVRLTEHLDIATPAYIRGRDLTEILLGQRIAELEQK